MEGLRRGGWDLTWASKGPLWWHHGNRLCAQDGAGGGCYKAQAEMVEPWTRWGSCDQSGWVISILMDWGWGVDKKEEGNDFKAFDKSIQKDETVIKLRWGDRLGPEEMESKLFRDFKTKEASGYLSLWLRKGCGQR